MRFRFGICVTACVLTLSLIGLPVTPVMGQASGPKLGYAVDVPVPLGADTAAQVLDQLKRLAESVPEGDRVTVVLNYPEDVEGGEVTPFEDALKLARGLTSPELRALKTASFVQGTIKGHSVLPVLASDVLVLGSGAVIEDASAAEKSVDETVTVGYRAVAARRGLFPAPIVTALVDPGVELARVTKASGGQVFVGGDELKELRAAGDVLGEDVWSAPGSPLRLEANQLRDAKIAAGIVDSVDGVAEILDLAEISEIDSSQVSGKANGVLLDISGAISSNRVRRWQSNLDATLANGEINTWIVSIDSSGGDFDESALLAGTFASPAPPLRTVAGLIQEEARGDAALIAMSCKPLHIKSEATLGGPGQDSITTTDLENYSELIQQIAKSTRRPEALIRGLLCPDLEVYEFTNKRTGRVKFCDGGRSGSRCR